MAKRKRKRWRPSNQRQHRLMVDASALMALFDPNDPFHEPAIAFRDNFILRYTVRLFTTNYVYSEAMSHLTRRVPIERLQRLDALIRNPPAADPLKLTQLWVEPSTVEKAAPIYFQYLEHDFSVTDCTTFILMQEHEIHAAFTFDSDFRIYTYQKGHETFRRGFWVLPEMLEEYMGSPASHLTVR